MTDEQNYRKEILNDLASVDEAEIIGKTLELSGDVKLEAEKEKYRYGLEAALDGSLWPDDRQRHANEAELLGLPEQEREKKISEYFGHRHGITFSRAQHTLTENIDEALKEGEKFSPKLVEIANAKELVESAKGSNRELLEQYAPVVMYKNVVNKLDNGEHPDLDPKSRHEIASNGAAMEMYEWLKKQGAPDSLIKAAVQAASLAPSEKVSDELLLKGSKIMLKNSERDLENYVGKDNEGRQINYEDKVAEAVGGVLTDWAKSQDPKRVELLTRLYYRAYEGYLPGERSFDEAFKKE